MNYKNNCNYVVGDCKNGLWQQSPSVSFHLSLPSMFLKLVYCAEARRRFLEPIRANAASLQEILFIVQCMSTHIYWFLFALCMMEQSL